MDLSEIHRLMDGIESQFKSFTDKAHGEITTIGKLSTESANAIAALGVKQRELADEIVILKQQGTAGGNEEPGESWGQQLVKSPGYLAFISGSATRAHYDVKNTLVGADAIVAPDRRPGYVAGATQPLTLENFLPKVPTAAGAIEYSKETSFTNNAAAVAEAAQKPESALTWSLQTMPISTIAHWIKISKQLAADAPALQAYVDVRMRYGVDRVVESQLVVGDGVAPNLSGFMKSGNYTAHGILSGAVGTTLPKLVLIRLMIANLQAAGFPPDAIVLSPQEWASIEIGLITTAAGQTLYSVNEAGTPVLFGLPVIQSIGMAADTVAVGAFAQACTIYDRQQVTVDMSESDGDNFVKNLITMRAERRLALVVERPAAILAGDLTPPAS